MKSTSWRNLRITSIRFSPSEVSRPPLAGDVNVPHFEISLFQVSRELLGVEERRSFPVACQPGADVAELRRMARQPQGQRFVVGERGRDQFGQTDGPQQTAGDP